MRSFVLRWLVLSLAIFIVANITDLIYIENFKALILGSLILGILNVFLKPILLFFTMPLTVMTLGLFVLVINGIVLYLVSFLVSGFEIFGLGKALLAALLLTILSTLINWIIRD
ncbi:MAG: hypothetical protein AMJ90_07955 [candidate division Zixibacteria bacterium SM23_73_2]|nr:MAG: hypothetical protein AMJ90_07955 [candidate division Zixibacteria bacterium SM23_73_2]